MVVILDTDVLSLLKRQSQPAVSRLHQRLHRFAPDEVWTTIVSFEEQARGWLAAIHQARSDGRVLIAYAELRTFLGDFSRMNVLPFDQAAQAEMARLQHHKVRIGTLDLRIAAIALANGATLVSRNLKDFRKVPGLVVEDWTQ